MAERVGAVVIGAGQAGLAASHHLSRLGRDHVVLEQRQIAAAWRRRWDSFTLVTPNWTIRLPGAEYAGDSPDGFMPRDDLVAHLERYAAGAPIRTGVKATAVDPDPVDGGFVVGTSDGPIRARAVVVASGMYARPRRGPANASLPPRMYSLHTDEYRNPDGLPPGGVLIVGSGQSGAQVAEELLEAGRDVYLSTGTAGRIRRRYRGRDSMRWALDIGFFDRPATGLTSPKDRYAANAHLSGKRGGHTLNLHRFAADGMTLLGRLAGIDGERATFAPDLHDNLRKSDTVAVEFSGLIDKHIAQEGIDAPEARPDNTDEYAGRDGFEQPIRTDLDLRAAGISTVIWAGGFGLDLSWVHAPVFADDGFPNTQRGVTSIPGLTFLGLAFLYTFRSSLLLGVGDDAAHVAESIVATT